ncbi:DUF1259 domain-containing protein [Paenactinomyces guangxiensis]|uniref:DUF1259 domain-containing protein n=1 Tax=Paenactinomyces guangxiensis TaxID=1490290 RepID=A0A7W2A6T5_9BACL|nr:DUF1259 domain-containing protein [Paenactinomyces guangxiensis]MBA4493771.1 DUF1259 domain-containing protein [Paenactinomyces guangxiensis]MBH8591060.1 DUF1259 domain-containing protein [Paenactinomyces guangxiensis]
MNALERLCNQFARIVDGQPSIFNGVCFIQKFRPIRATILGQRTRSPLVLPTFFTFESIDRRGRALNLGETVILQQEINPFISALRRGGIIVTSLHNHWLFEQPRLMYIHFESVENPIIFARKAAAALRVLRK